MFEHQLDQTLIVHPATPYATIAAALTALGWQRDESAAPARSPVLAAEPEHALWRGQAEKPYLVYSFNPVARLRLLDVATLSPAQRGGIAQALPLLDKRAIQALFSAEQPGDRLLGLWAARETQRLDLISQAQRLAADSEPAVAAQGQQVAEALAKIADARLQVTAHLRLVAEAARKVISELGDSSLTPYLCPSGGDCAKLFDGGLAKAMAQRAADLYQRPPTAAPGADYPQLEVTAIQAGLLRWPNELSEAFPRGYRHVAGWLKPDRIWLSWRYHAEGDPSRAVSYDGLTWLDDHWVWLPKVYRLMAPLVAGSPAATVH